MKKDPAQKAIDENSNLEDLWQEIFQKTIDLSQSYYTYGIKTAEKQMTDDYGIHKAFTSAHGNSLRSIIMHIEGLSEEQVLSLEVPTGQPMVYAWSESGWERHEL